MNSLQKRAIAKMAYKEMKEVYDKWQNHYGDLRINLHWSGSVTVEDELFLSHHLKDYDGPTMD